MTEDVSGSTGKGRPTPKRSEVQAQRKASLKRDAKSLRARQRAEREAARRAMLAGDERYYPPRDQGPIKAWVRTYVDSRFSAGELFVPLAFAILILSLIPNASVQAFVFFAWLGMIVVLIMDSIALNIRLRRELRREFPNANLKGSISYGVLRALQMRRLRVPPVKVRVGGAPKTPKQK